MIWNKIIYIFHLLHSIIQIILFYFYFNVLPWYNSTDNFGKLRWEGEGEGATSLANSRNA